MTTAVVAISVAITSLSLVAITRPDVAHDFFDTAKKALEVVDKALDIYSRKENGKNDSDMGHENRRGRAVNH